MPLPDGALDFGYSLGVLHHIPDTQSALRACVRKLKAGAPFLLYLPHYAVHIPLKAKDEILAKYKGMAKHGSQSNPVYAAGETAGVDGIRKM